MNKINNNERDRRVTFPPDELQKKCLRYLCWYSSIDDLTSNKSIDRIYKGLTMRIRRIVPNGTIKIYTKNKLNEDGEIEWDFSKDRIYCNQWNNCSQIVALLRHLRNAIAHGRLIKKNGKIEIIDKETNGCGRITAKGYFESDTIKNVLETCIQSRV